MSAVGVALFERIRLNYSVDVVENGGEGEGADVAWLAT